MSRLLEKYKKDVLPTMMKDRNYKNINEAPRLEKIVVSMGIGKALENKNRIDAAVKNLAAITGQKPLVTKARKSISGFKLRQGQEIGCKVTLRGKIMFEFLDRLVTLAIPRLRDFRGLPSNAFDNGGNYNLGISEQTVFPEISIDKIEFTQGMNVTMVLKSRNKNESLDLLKRLGVPFREK